MIVRGDQRVWRAELHVVGYPVGRDGPTYYIIAPTLVEALEILEQDRIKRFESDEVVVASIELCQEGVWLIKGKK